MYKKIYLTSVLKQGLHRHIYKLSMKLALLLLFAGTAHASAPTFEQSITLKKTNAKMTAILKDIQRQSGYNIFYDASVVSANLTVSVDFNKNPLVQTLEALFKDHDLEYSIMDKNIILKRSAPLNNTVNASNVNKIDLQSSVQGNITNEKAEPMSNVSITEKGTANSVMSNGNGFYKITVTSSNAILVFTYLGYQK